MTLQDLSVPCDVSLDGSVSDGSTYFTLLKSSDDAPNTSSASLDAIEPTNITDNNCVASLVEDYNVAENIFSSNEILELKLREKVLR